MTSKAHCPLAVLVALTLISLGSKAQLPEPNGGAIERGVLPDRWMTGGPRCMEMPEWLVHEYNADLYILRQSGSIWPSPSNASERAARERAFQETQSKQLNHIWDQTLP